MGEPYMNVTIRPAPLQGTVRAIPSKSYMHRALLCASLADAPTKLICPASNRDIRATVGCLRALGAGIDERNGVYTVSPIQNTVAETVDLFCDESGSTLRFLLPFVAALGRTAVFHASGRLTERPLSPLYEQLQSHGVTLSENGVFPLSLSGKLQAGTFSLDGGISSQFFTGLLTALPLLSGESRLCIEGKLTSAPYLALTEAVLNRFGVTPTETETGWEIRPQSFRSPGVLHAEGDWSNAAFWLVAGALGAGITVCGLQSDSKQGDQAIVPLLRRMGAEIEEQNGCVSVHPSRLHGIPIYAEDIPDLVPILSVAAAAAEGETVITGASRLRLKESDRLQSVSAMLRALGIDCNETQDGLRIRGIRSSDGRQNNPPNAKIDGCNDHRIVMSAAVASVFCRNDITVCGAQAADKSYPAFFDDFRLLGGQFSTERT